MTDKIFPTSADDMAVHLLLEKTPEVMENCFLCEKPLHQAYTDWHGQTQCLNCGFTYQHNVHTIPEVMLDEWGVKRSEVQMPWSPQFQILPILKAFWEEEGEKVPGAIFLDHRTSSRHEAFNTWMDDNEYRLRPQCDQLFSFPPKEDEDEEIKVVEVGPLTSSDNVTPLPIIDVTFWDEEDDWDDEEEDEDDG